MISGVLLDLAGVVYDGNNVIGGAIDAVARLRRAGMPVRFVSNTTRSSTQAIVNRLSDLGLPVSSADLFTPSRAARDFLRDHALSPHFLVHPGLLPDFAGLPEGIRNAVVVGDAGESFDYQSLNVAFRALLDGAEFLALASNRTFRDVDGKLSLDAGAFVAALEFATERKAVVLGKPSRRFFHAALASMGCPASQAVMVGDDAESDVAEALQSGVGHALLVRTGKYRKNDENRFEPAPTAIVADIGAAADWILDRMSDP
ncbi:TIGR01458 family HAD-type hydrolase [Rhizobiaceae bacterium n13]|uniref:Haloacid dehalogenase-like hydrolase domain-containing protein 2 n=2 Tax=Ferirhizobium litorale TaxID=2927786 RepID=A0AAE3QFK2_9HYPH|nr:TIGR01458 family HAD-type hydrolase [Fererhizobium litorale]MDI7862117.1 TIGR01458 family HAD-type hydrolase [Fererhizobium litorale]MDI7922610.1 TIGR01458 family HAD-type hydrolase [Fererhizobium litorale]